MTAAELGCDQGAQGRGLIQPQMGWDDGASAARGSEAARAAAYRKIQQGEEESPTPDTPSLTDLTQAQAGI